MARGVDQVRQFLSLSSLDDTAECEVVGVQLAYARWCALMGKAPLSHRELGTALRELGLTTRDAGGVRWYLGIAPRPGSLWGGVTAHDAPPAVEAFLAERQYRRGPDYWVPAGELQEDYARWSRGRGRVPLGPNATTRALRAASVWRWRRSGQAVYVGVGAPVEAPTP